MKKTLLTAALCLSFALAASPLSQPAHGQQRKRSPKRPMTRATRLPRKEYVATAPLPDSGTLRDGIYTNEYFGLEITVPEGWRVLDDETSKQLGQRGGELMAGDSKDMKNLLQQAQTRTVYLFTFFKPIPAEGEGGTPTRALIVGVAEPILPGIIDSGEEYLDQVKILLGQAALKSEFDGPTVKESIGGVEFATQQVRQTYLGVVLKQKLSATIRRRHAIIMTRVYTNEAGEQVADDVIRTIKFK